MRIAILGYSGSGKSTLAKALSERFDLPLLYLDTVQFEANWEERDRDKARAMVDTFLLRLDWVIDGNYAPFSLDRRLEPADHILYLSFSRFTCLFRAIRRYIRHRNTTRESMAEGCAEKMDPAFLWWILYQGRSPRKRQFYAQALARHAAKVQIFRSQRELDRFLAQPFAPK